MKHILTSLLLLSFCSSISAQNTWYIPDDFSTIQSGINGSSNGDTVIVRDGTYFENINFSGKAITLKSEYGPATTIIDGMSNGTTGVSFSSGEGSDSILEGFTVTNCSTGIGAVGAGIGVHAGASPVIRGNWIVDNTRAVPSGRTASGAGADISGDGTLFENNIVRGNTTIGTHTWGGGVVVGGSASLGIIVRNNLIYENTAASWPGGGGICVGDGNQNTLIENNTIFNNNASNGGGITVDYRSSGTTIRNNIVWGNTGGVTIEDGGVSSVTYNCVESGFTGTGNISTDPLFLDAANDDFQLQAGSPCIDAADPNSDLDPDGTRADMGAFFFPQALFGSPHTIYSGAADGPRSVISEDIDNDGDLDVVYGTYTGKDLFWNENMGSGAFAPEQIIGTDVGSIQYVRMADLDGDGLKDLIYTCWAGGAGVQWMKHLGGGSFGPAQAIDAQMAAEKIDTADLDGDGDIDIAIAIGRFESEGGAFKWYENNGAGGFTIHILAQSAYPKGAHCADMNGDGNIDILVAGWTRNDISWFENMGSGSFVKHAISTPYEAYDVLAIDADGDGDADIVYSNNGNGSSGSVYSVENLGNGSFGPETLISSRPTGAARLETADVDLDGDLDLFWVAANVDEVTWHENLGSMTFGPEENIDSQLGGGSGLCAADVDGDGDKDILLAVSGSGSNISWYENLGVPSGNDSDNDGLLDADEILASTDPFDFDTDNDGLGDGQEMGVVNGTPYTNMAIFVPDADPTTTTDPLNADTDGGGVADGIEDQNRDGAISSWETDPNNTTDEELAFYVSGMSPGVRLHFEVYNAGNNNVIVPACSVAGAGPTLLGIGVMVDLSLPIIPLSPVLSDSQGRGSWDGPRVPTSLNLGRQVWLQLVEMPLGASGHRVSNAILLPVGAN